MKRLVNGKSKTKCLNGCRTLNSKSLEGDQNIYILSVVKGEITKKVSYISCYCLVLDPLSSNIFYS